MLSRLFKGGSSPGAKTIAETQGVNIGAPSKDSLDLVPVAAIAPPFVITKSGSYLLMMELPPLHMGISSKGYEYWVSKYEKALSTLPPGTQFEVVILMEPCNASPDLEYFIKRSEKFQEASYDENAPPRVKMQHAALRDAAQVMSADMANWFDSRKPISYRTILVLSHKPGIQSVKSIFSSAPAASITRETIESQMPSVTEALGQKASVIRASFSGAGIDLLTLSAADMCHVFWRALHPTATGTSDSTAVDMAISLASGEEPSVKSAPALDEFVPELSTEAIGMLLAPTTVLEFPNHIEVEGIKLSGFVLHDFRPNQVAFLNRLSSLPSGWSGSMFVEITDPALVVDRLRHREVQLAAMGMAKSSKGMLTNYGDQQETSAVQASRAQLEMVGQSPIFIRFYVMMAAEDVATLNVYNRDLQSLLNTIGVQAFQAQYSQMLLWKSIWPSNEMHLAQKARNMTPGALSHFFWPQQARYMEDAGIYMGIDIDTGLPIRFDVFGDRLDRNPTSLALGEPGSGKSVWLRTVMVSAMLSGGQVLAIDLEGEMQEFCAQYGGRYIDIGSPEGERINILDIPPDTDQPLEVGTNHLISFAGAVRGGLIPPGSEWNALAEAYRIALIDRRWITADGKATPGIEWHRDDAPLLNDISRILQIQQSDTGHSLAEMLLPYSEGLYAPYFNVSTTFDIRNEHLVIFGLKRVNADTNTTLLRVYLWQVMGLIWGEVLRRYAVNPDIATHVFLDEVWKLLEAPNGGPAIENMARRFRKRRAALWMATQQINEFLGSDVGQRILDVVSNKYLLQLPPTAAKKIQKLYGLSDSMTHHLSRLGTGQGILMLPQRSMEVMTAVPKAWGAY